MIHPQAIVETTDIGENTRIWAFAHILPGAKIGCDCNICDYVFIENDVIVGDRVTIKSGVQLWDGVRIENDVLIGPNATLTNDKFPRSKHYEEEFQRIVIRQFASIGANATILPGITIGKKAIVGAGAVVTRDVPPNAIVMGNPSRITGYVSFSGKRQTEKRIISHTGNSRVEKCKTKGVEIYYESIITDIRGSLSFGELGNGLPFVPKRFFIVYDVPSVEVRGEHAHKELHEFLVCARGSCTVLVDDSQYSEEITLNSPNIGLHIPPLIWTVQFKYTSDSVLVVLASDEYDVADYIRDYDEFLDTVKAKTLMA